MNPKETWIDETLNSLDGIRPSTADPGLYESLASVRNKKTHRNSVAAIRSSWAIAAGLALLLTLNITAIIYLNSASTQSADGPAAVAQEYLAYLDSIKI